MNHARQRSILKRDLQVVAWNANGVPHKIEDIREFLARIKPDVLLIGETHLTPGKNVRFPNYVLYRDDRLNRRGGGTVIAVKTSIRHNRMALPPLAHMEATAVELPGVLGGLLLVSGYTPPRSVFSDSDLSSIFDAHRNVILATPLG